MIMDKKRRDKIAFSYLFHITSFRIFTVIYSLNFIYKVYVIILTHEYNYVSIITKCGTYNILYHLTNDKEESNNFCFFLKFNL